MSIILLLKVFAETSLSDENLPLPTNIKSKTPQSTGAQAPATNNKTQNAPKAKGPEFGLFNQYSKETADYYIDPKDLEDSSIDNTSLYQDRTPYWKYKKNVMKKKKKIRVRSKEFK